jgi:hypothetical protein
MALTKFTDAAGREAWQDESGRVFTEGGTRDTFYNVNDWNTRQTQKYGTSSSSASSTPSYSNTFSKDAGMDFTSIANSLKGFYSGDTAKYEAELSKNAEAIKKASEEAAAAKKAQIPLVQNIYSKLAAELALQMEEEQGVKKQEKTEGIASMDEEAARSGFETGTGFEAAMRRNLADKYDKQIAQVANKWGIQRERLAAEEIKSIKDLEAEAAMAISQGNSEVADINKSLIGIKQNEQSLIQSATINIMNAQNDREAQYQNQIYQNALLDLKERELDLQAQKIQIDAQNAGSKDRVQIVQGGDGEMYVVNLDTGEKTPLGVQGGTDRETQYQQDLSQALKDLDGVPSKDRDAKAKEVQNAFAKAYPDKAGNTATALTKYYGSSTNESVLTNLYNWLSGNSGGF